MADKGIQQEEMERKIYRHKRRVRNQIISYIVITIIFAGLIAGGIIGVRKIVDIINDKKQAEELEKQLEEIANAEDGQQAVEAPSEGLEPEPEEETDWLEEPYVPHRLVGVMAQNTIASAGEGHVWSIGNQKI